MAKKGSVVVEGKGPPRGPDSNPPERAAHLGATDREQFALQGLYTNLRITLADIRTRLLEAVDTHMGIQKDPDDREDEHKWTARIVRDAVAADQKSMARYTHLEWAHALRDVGFWPRNFATDLPKASSLHGTFLSSDQVLQQVTGPLAKLFMTESRDDWDRALNFVRDLEVHNPVMAYVYHMGLSLHDVNTQRSIMRLLRDSNISLKGPFADVACGPGHATDRLVQSGVIRSGKLIAIDPDEKYAEYARSILRRSCREKGIDLTVVPYGAQGMDRDAEVIKHLPLGTIITSMALQWLPKDVAPLVVESMVRSLKRGGHLISVGEAPLNVTAPTPYSIIREGDIGYSDGPLSHRQITDLFLEYGLRFRGVRFEEMGMKSNAKGAGIELPGPPIQRVLSDYSRHVMITSAWEKVND